MNIFRLVGDMSHLLAILLLLMKMWKSRSVAGTCVFHAYSVIFLGNGIAFAGSCGQVNFVNKYNFLVNANSTAHDL